MKSTTAFKRKPGGNRLRPRLVASLGFKMIRGFVVVLVVNYSNSADQRKDEFQSIKRLWMWTQGPACELSGGLAVVGIERQTDGQASV